MSSDDAIITRLSARLLTAPPPLPAAETLVPDWAPEIPFARPPVPAAVLIALVRRPEGHTVLYTERSPDLRAHSGQVAFPGGKVDAGESHAQALMRECEEELAVTLAVGDLYMCQVHAYPDVTVRLSLYHARIVRGRPRMLEHAALRWVRPGELDRYDFCPADIQIIARLMEEYAG